MTRSTLGGVLAAFGFVMVAVLAFVVHLPSEGLKFAAHFFLGVVPIVAGAALLWSDRRGSRSRESPEERALSGIKDQVLWRAMAGGGRITAADVAAQGELPRVDVERALLSLVAEGRAAAEAGEDGEIVYVIQSH